MSGAGTVWSGMSASTPLPSRWRVVEENEARVTFADGQVCLDANSGLWNVPLGYRHPGVQAAISKAAESYSYGAQFNRSSDIAEELGARLLGLWPDNTFDRVLFATSGSAANDLVIKLSRLWHRFAGQGNRDLIASMRGSYHGQTLGALGVSDEYLRQPDMLGDASLFRRLDLADAARTRAALQRWGDRLAAVFIEPVQGTGNRTIAGEVLAEIFAARAEHGFLVVADEVATGFGRTGHMLRSALWLERPDVVVLSKALTNGTMAMSCILVQPRISGVFQSSDRCFPHAETQAGSAVACAATLGVLQAFEEQLGMRAATDRLPRLDRMDTLLTRLDLERRGVVARGEGYFMTFEIPGVTSGRDAVETLRDEGVIVHGSERGFQLVPSFLMTNGDWDLLAETLDRYLATVTSR